MSYKVEIETLSGTETYEVEGKQSLLTELEEKGAKLDFNCRQGHCGLCVKKLVSGNVEQRDSLVSLSKDEILVCCSRPVSDIKIK